jgi:hypothetical protein
VFGFDSQSATNIEGWLVVNEDPLDNVVLADKKACS